MPDYSQLIDAETWAFIERTNGFYPPDATGLSVAGQRAVYDRMCRAFFAGYPEGVSATTGAIEAEGRSIRIRTYSVTQGGEETVVVYFHGGGFILGGLESHDDVCAELCAGTGYRVVSVDYRLAPEHIHPAAFDDALAAYRHVCASGPRTVLLCGDSAGGNLAAAVAHAARDTSRPADGQLLIYPGLGGDASAGSYVEHAEAPMLTTADVLYYDRVRTGDATPAADPTRDPLSDGDFSRLPPTVVVTAQCDPLSSDGEAYRDRILAAGGKAVWIEEPGLVHGYLRARHSVGRARASFDRIVRALAALGRREWPALG